MNFITPIAFFGMLIALPILLMYMLRLRRREVVVSSNFLWQQIVHDQEANTPWQRLRRNVLLLLQLLILLLLVLALARPAQIVPSVSAGRSIILLDASASMNATDGAEGATRWQRALDEARTLINTMSDGDEMSLIRVGTFAEPLTGYTSDQNTLRTALDGIEVSAGAGDWDTALTLAVAGAQSAEEFNIIIIGDGGLEDITTQLPETVREPIYIPIGEHSDNLAISALAVRDIADASPQLFAQVTNYSDTASDIALVIRLDGALWQSSTQTVNGNSQRAFIFAIDQAFTVVTAEIVAGGDVVDYLALDDSAWAIASETRTRRVLLIAEGGNRFLEQALASIADVETFRGDATRTILPDQTYDLYVFDGYLPEVLPDGDMLIINPPRDSTLFTLGEQMQDIGAWRITAPDHPLTAFLDVEAVNLRTYQRINAEWGETLLQAETANGMPDGALLIAGEDNGRQIALLPFDLRASDLPLQLTFPILMANMIEWYSPANILDNTRPFVVGETIPVRPPVEATALRLTQPDGTSQTIAIEGAGIALTNTYQVGLYTLEILQGDRVVASVPFAMTLFGTDESNITPRASISIGGAQDASNAEEQFGWREYWQWIALGGLAILLLEWWVYYRRLRAPQLARVQVNRTTARR